MECYFELKFSGNWANNNQIQFYDVAQALVGFERVISLTTHLLLSGEVHTQSPSTRGFQLIALPAEEGSWKWTIGLALGIGQAMHAFGTAPPDTAFGWLTKSAVEYVVQETLGFTPNFDETLGKQIERYRNGAVRQEIDKNLSIERFDSLIEKTESGVKAIHRPIVRSGSAEVANFGWRTQFQEESLAVYADSSTFEYVDRIITKEDFVEYCGYVSSYNVNTFKGRLYIPNEQRTIPFELSDTCRDLRTIRAITSSLAQNATVRARRLQNSGSLCLKALRNETQSGRLKSIFVVELTIRNPRAGL